MVHPPIMENKSEWWYLPSSSISITFFFCPTMDAASPKYAPKAWTTRDRPPSFTCNRMNIAAWDEWNATSHVICWRRCVPRAPTCSSRRRPTRWTGRGWLDRAARPSWSAPRHSCCPLISFCRMYNFWRLKMFHTSKWRSRRVFLQHK